MAEIQEKSDSGKRGKQKKFNVRVDFTPMVDMNMLLITFFMLCTSMSKPQTMEIAMPRKDVIDDDMTLVKESNAVTILLGKNDKVYYYTGRLTDADYENPDKLKEANFSGDENSVRTLLLGRNNTVVQQIKDLKRQKENLEIADSTYKKLITEVKKNKDAPRVSIKASDFANYKNMIDALDEMHICNIGVYSIEDITPGDLRLLENLTGAGYEPQTETEVKQ
ncbi:MAG: biopolymer transporter ExbD [Prevotellaceae bacterium]|jgi:biopolymer transport protein ExbD|nr:biopolymer transporter ExbD [Prevotellaceae bacterium]